MLDAAVALEVERWFCLPKSCGRRDRKSATTSFVVLGLGLGGDLAVGGRRRCCPAIKGWPSSVPPFATATTQVEFLIGTGLHGQAVVGNMRFLRPFVCFLRILAKECCSRARSAPRLAVPMTR